LALLAFAVPGAVSAQASEQTLAWLDKADPVVMFTDSTRLNRVHFLEVCGLTCETPGMGPLTYGHCYAQEAGVLRIDATGDMITSDRHAALKEKALAFAKRYNNLVQESLDSSGKRHCPTTEQWDKYWGALEKLAEQIPAHPYASFVLGIGDPAFSHADFQLHVQDPVDLSLALYRRACALAIDSGILRRVRFLVTTGNINDNPTEHPGFACSRGTVAG
jgi:hypothetical protein